MMLAPFRERPHVQPMQVFREVEIDRLVARRFPDSRANQFGRFRMQLERHAKRRGRALARVVIRRGADPARRKHNIARCKRPLERGRDALTVIANIFRPIQRQSPRRQQFDNFWQMLVGPSTGQYLVANDDHAKAHECSLILKLAGNSQLGRRAGTAQRRRRSVGFRPQAL
jgi:hypothetical protein